MLKRLWRQARDTELARHGSILFLALTLANISNYLFHMVISRLLGPADYGAFGAVLACFVVISVPAGAVQTVVAKRTAILRVRQEDGELGSVLRSLLRGSLIIAVLGGFMLGAASPLLAQFLRLDSVIPALMLAGYLSLTTISTVIRGLLQGRMQFKPLATLTAGSTILRLAFGALFVVSGAGVSGAVAASLVAEVSVVVGGLLSLRSLLRQKTKRVSLQGFLKEGQMAVLAFTGFWLLVSIDTVLVRHFFPTEVSGFYAAGAVAAHAILFLPGAIAMVAFPKFAETEGRTVEARRTLFHSIVAVGVLGFGAAGFLSLFSSPIVHTLFGGDFSGGTVVVGVLGFAMALLGIANVLIYFHLASNSKALFSLVPSVLLLTLGITVFHDSILEVAVMVFVVSAGFLGFNLLAAYARPGDPNVQPAVSGELWHLANPEVDLTIVTPAFNPGVAIRENVERMLEAVTRFGMTYEVIAVSDGSTDRSYEHLDGLTDSGVEVIHYEVNRGKGYALRMGLAKARGRFVAFIDSDGDIAASEIKNFIALMKDRDVDLVVGSKRHPSSQVSYPWTRRAMSWTYHSLVRLLFGIKLSDTQTGLKVAKREVLAQVLPRMLEKRFAFDLELLVVARVLGFRRVLEAPVHLDYKFSSTVSWRTALATGVDTMAIFYRRYILRYYHQVAEDQRRTPIEGEAVVPPELVEVR